MNKPQLIDCTIRDGGYLNDWKFDARMVVDSYIAARDAGVPYFEIGYRNPITYGELGLFGYCQDSFITPLLAREYNSKCKLVVMTDAKNFGSFLCKRDSLISVVRVCFYPEDMVKAFNYAQHLKELGYEVCLNPMVTHVFSSEDVKLIAYWAKNYKALCVYVADSFGCFDADCAKYEYSRFTCYGAPRIGFHGHNNLQLAVSNSLAMAEIGASFVDGTIYGMGRGAGNAPIEILCALFGYDPNPYFKVIEKWYKELNKQSWGAFPEYVQSGFRAVHPYYADYLSPRTSFEERDKIYNDLPIKFSLEKACERVEELK